ncbi:glycosyltransferase [Brachybacterium huguangmaarense]
MRPVDVVIACHTPDRPVGRAVASVLSGNGDLADVTVVCHNTPVEDIASAISPDHRNRVRLVEHRDVHRSASGPFNAGIDSSTSPFVAIMGSDDMLMPGAVASWLTVHRRTGADMVLTRLALGTAAHGVPTPAVRILHHGAADLVRDRLAYRSAPLGLMDRSMLHRSGARLVEGRTVGGDVAMVTRLMATETTAYDAWGPPYVIGEDAHDRVTLVRRPIREQLGFFPDLLDADWFTRLDRSARAAIGTKLLRIHVFGAVFYRADPGVWTQDERTGLAAITATVLDRAPRCHRPLSRADRDLLDACLDPQIPAPVLIAAARRRRRHGRISTLVPRQLSALGHREAPLRFMAASLGVRWLPRIAGIAHRSGATR